LASFDKTKSRQKCQNFGRSDKMVNQRITKAVKFGIEENNELVELLAKFRDLVNFCVERGLEKNISSRFKLIKEVYNEAKEFGLHTHYLLNACEIACSMLKNYRKVKRRNKKVKEPKAKRLFLKLDNQTYKLIKKDGLCLRIPTKPRKFLLIKLKYGSYQKEFLNRNYKLGSITINLNNVIIAFSKEVEIKKPERIVAIDVNETNLTCVASDGLAKVYDLKPVKTIRYAYYLKKKSIQKKVKNRKLRRELLKKYSGKEKRKVEWFLHNIAKQIVEDFQDSEFVLENLKGIREAINKRELRKNKYNGKIQLHRTKPKKLLRRLNSWPFKKVQFFIEYKALWNNNLVSYLDPRKTSSICPICGYKLELNGHRVLRCENCGYENDRDIIACLNLLKMKGVRFSPDRLMMTKTTDEGVSKLELGNGMEIIE